MLLTTTMSKKLCRLSVAFSLILPLSARTIIVNNACGVRGSPLRLYEFSYNHACINDEVIVACRKSKMRASSATLCRVKRSAPVTRIGQPCLLIK